MSRRKAKRGKQKRRHTPARQEVRVDELHAILARARRAALSREEVKTLSAAVDTLAFITQELEQSGVTVKRLRKLLFGSSSEKTKDVLAAVSGGGDAGGDDGSSAGAQGEDSSSSDKQAASTGEKRIVTAIGSPATRISGGSSTAPCSVSPAYTGMRR